MPDFSSMQAACMEMPSVRNPLRVPVNANMLSMHEARVAARRAVGGGISPYPPIAFGMSVMKLAEECRNTEWQRMLPVTVVVDVKWSCCMV